jgi:tyrosyl-tRNA synthetase
MSNIMLKKRNNNCFEQFNYDVMDIDERIELIMSEPTEEVITREDLRKLLETKSRPRHYIGFEISGMPHIGHILVAGKKINDLEKAGVETQVLLADWHTVANNKLGGDWERIRTASEFYKRLFNTVCPNTKVVLGSDLYSGNDDYWKLVIQMARKTTMARATRTLIIEGRSEKDTLHVSQYIYPILQAADIHALDVDIPHAGVDQRRVHMLAKELFKDLRLREIVPLHHHLLASLAEPPKVELTAEKEEIVAAMKMSKSKPGSAISILSTTEEIKKILDGAWSPVKVVDENPVLELCRYVILPSLGKLVVRRNEKYGGDIEFDSFKELEAYYKEGKLHPADLKSAVAENLDVLIKPIRDKFINEKEELLRLFY